jgi:hypothetical protein
MDKMDKMDIKVMVVLREDGVSVWFEILVFCE